MADEAGDKTEDASPRRREEARKQGQVAYSQDFAGSMGLLAGIVGLIYMGQSIGGGLLEFFRSDLPHLLHDDLDVMQTRNIFLKLYGRAVFVLGGFFGTLLAVGVATGIIQVGFHITPEKLEPDFDKLNPANGVSRLFSVASIVRGLLALLKVIGLGVVVALFLRSRIGEIMTLGEASLPAAISSAWGLALRLALFMVAIIAILGVADFIYQKQRFEASLRMSKQELKEELKREEGDPLIKVRIRQLARQRARQKMLSAVPKATVIITNPQHLAVALQYDQSKAKSAPVVVAKGAGAWARRIVELARKHGVPVIERAPVAQILYKTVAEGKEIPSALFRVIAEILALVYRHRQPGAFSAQS